MKLEKHQICFHTKEGVSVYEQANSEEFKNNFFQINEKMFQKLICNKPIFI